MEYNPKDIWHEPYFSITDTGIERNKKCALSEEDYKKLCRFKGVEPFIIS